MNFEFSSIGVTFFVFTQPLELKKEEKELNLYEIKKWWEF